MQNQRLKPMNQNLDLNLESTERDSERIICAASGVFRVVVVLHLDHCVLVLSKPTESEPFGTKGSKGFS